MQRQRTVFCLQYIVQKLFRLLQAQCFADIQIFLGAVCKQPGECMEDELVSIPIGLNPYSYYTLPLDLLQCTNGTDQHVPKIITYTYRYILLKQS